MLTYGANYFTFILIKSLNILILRVATKITSEITVARAEVRTSRALLGPTSRLPCHLWEIICCSWASLPATDPANVCLLGSWNDCQLLQPCHAGRAVELPADISSGSSYFKCCFGGNIRNKRLVQNACCEAKLHPGTLPDHPTAGCDGKIWMTMLH